MMLTQFETVRTMIDVPAELHNRSQHFIDTGTIPDHNALIIAAIEQFLHDLERREIDRQFDGMADDEAYHALNDQIVDDFAESDWDALLEGEKQ